MVTRLLATAATGLGLGVPAEADAAAQILAYAAGRLKGLSASGDVDALLRMKAAMQGPLADTLRQLGRGEITPGNAILLASGTGFDRFLAEVDPPGIPPDYEPLSPPTLVIQPFPDGTKKITVIGEITERLPKKKKNSKVPGPEFQITVPVLPKTKLALTEVTVEINVPDGGPAFLEVRSRANNYKTVVARIAVTPGTGTYTIPLTQTPGTKPGTLRFFGVGGTDPEAVIDYSKVTVTGILYPAAKQRNPIALSWRRPPWPLAPQGIIQPAAASGEQTTPAGSASIVAGGFEIASDAAQEQPAMARTDALPMEPASVASADMGILDRWEVSSLSAWADSTCSSITHDCFDTILRPRDDRGAQSWQSHTTETKTKIRSEEVLFTRHLGRF